jgi:hypothetical protein
VLWQEGLPSKNDGNWSILKVASLWKGMDSRSCCQQPTWRCNGAPTRHEGLSLSFSCAFPLLLFLLCFLSSSTFCSAFSPLSFSVVLSLFFLFPSSFLFFLLQVFLL